MLIVGAVINAFAVIASFAIIAVLAALLLLLLFTAPLAVIYKR